MMNAINFVVRTPAGAVTRSSVGGAGEGFLIDASGSNQVSLNLHQADVSGYTREGSDLLVTLADGRVIVLEGYFDGGAASRLYLSADGILNEATLVSGPDGQLYAQYGNTETWGKWSPSDDLMFYERPAVMASGQEEEVSMLAEGLLGSAVLGPLGAGAAVLGGLAVLRDGSDGDSSTSVDDAKDDEEQPDDGETDDGGDAGGDEPPRDDEGTGDTPDGEEKGKDGDETGDGETGDETGDGETGDETGDGETGDETGDGETGDETGDGETGGETGDGETGDETGDGETGDETGDGETGDETGDGETGDETGDGETGGETGDGETGGEGGDQPPRDEEDTGSGGDTDVGEKEKGGPAVPTVDNPDVPIAVGGTDDPRIPITGTGEPGSDVTVTIGDSTDTTVVTEDGTWGVEFDGDDIPADGHYDDVSVVVVDYDGTETDLAGPSVTIDLTPPVLEITDGTVATGDIVNAEDQADGATVTGTSEPGATVEVILGDHSASVVADVSGNWSVTFDTSVIVEGEYIAAITVTATDAAGNATQISDGIDVDTVPDPLTIDPVGGDDLVNAAEAATGFAITGSAVAGATVVVSFGENSYETSANDSGVWSVIVAPSDVEGGEYDADITAVTVDRAGNSTTVTSELRIDTVNALSLSDTPLTGDDIINAEEFAGGVALSGTAQPGASVMVEIDGLSQEASVDAEGNWTIALSDLAAGSYATQVVITATDTAGNVETLTHAFSVDTDVSVTLDGPIAGDGMVNVTEAAEGFALTGTAEAGTSISVEFGGQVYTTSTGEAGTWLVAIPAGAAGSGTFEAAIAVTATDSAGNSTGTSGSVIVDTETSVSLGNTPLTGDDVINATELAGGVVLSGSAEAGATVLVEVAGLTQEATVAADGSWSVTFIGLEGGSYGTQATVTATDVAGNTATTTHAFAVDTETSVSLSDTPVEGDGIVNGAEHVDGVTLTGTAEPGASVIVTLAGTSHAATVAADGSWSVNFAASEIPTGETSVTVTAEATDAAGNVMTDSGEIAVDTLLRDFAMTSAPGGADGVVNAAEHAEGLTLTGTTEPGATVVLTLGGVTHAATVAADGSWTATFSAAELPTGEQTVALSATSTDAAGNSETLTQNVVIDTDAGLLTISPEPIEGDDVVNAAEASDGVVVTGTSTPGQTVVVTLAGVSHSVVTAADGTWSAGFSASEVPSGTSTAEITATITDAAGNTLTRSDTVGIDTEVVNFAMADMPVETDNVVNAVEAADGIVLTGTTEPGATVSVTLEGTTHTATVDAEGNWSVGFAASELPEGEYATVAQVSTTDAAGNTATLSKSFEVDSYVSGFATAPEPIAGDGMVNAQEAREGFTLTGSVEPGSAVTLTVAGVSLAATVDAAGGWSVDIPGGLVPEGTETLSMQIDAVDAAGNTASILETVAVDTEVPVAPDVESYTRDLTGLRGITLASGSEDVVISHVVDETTGEIENVGFNSYELPSLGETAFSFSEVVPDGSHLVVTSTDTAGNASGTYLVVDDTTTSEVTMTDDLASALSEFNIETVDLQFAEESELTITEAQLVALSDNSDTLVVEGGSDDSVTITGAQPAGNDGEGYNVFSLGEATLFIDEDITNVVI